MSRSQHQQMRDAINDVELALNGLEIDSVARLFETADDSVMVKVPLGALRQLARCYPTLNRIINDPAFERKSMSRPATIVISDWLANCRAGQWTPFEAATALKEALRKEDYVIVPTDQWLMPSPADAVGSVPAPHRTTDAEGV